MITAFKDVLERGHYVFLCGSGEYRYEAALQELRDQYPEQCGVYFGFNAQFAHDIYAGCDFFLMPSLFEPCGIGQLLAKRYGTLPIARKTGGLADTICAYDGGNAEVADGFLFNDFDIWGLLWAIHQAEHVYSQDKEMDKMIANAMRCDHSWKKSGQAYLALYSSLLA